MRSLVVLLAACSSSAPPPAAPVAPEAPMPPPIDAAPVVVDPVATLVEQGATPHVFRFSSAERSETWTLWFANGQGVVRVAAKDRPEVQYTGTAVEGASLVVEVASPTGKLALDCKRAQRELTPPCTGKKSKPMKVAALDCFVAGFAEPMPFAPAPGIEYVADGTCPGYRTPGAL